MAGDIEDVKHKVADRIRSPDFLDLLAAVDAEKDDGSVVPPPITPGPTQVFEGEKVNVTDMGYPVCEVIAVRSKYNQETDAKDVWHEVHVFWTQAGDDELTITRDIERLVRATRDLFWPKLGRDTLQDVRWSGPVVVVSEDFTALAPKVNKTGFVKGSWTVLLVRTFSV